MPYYAGDYYVGDPGFFSFLKKAARFVGKVAAGPLGSLAASLIPGGGIVHGLLTSQPAKVLREAADILSPAGGLISPIGGLMGGLASRTLRRAAGGTPGAVSALARHQRGIRTAHAYRGVRRYGARRRRRRY